MHILEPLRTCNKSPSILHKQGSDSGCASPEDYEQDFQQFEAGYYEEDRSRRGGREASPEVGEYVSEDEAKRAEKKARKKHKKEKKEKKHKKDKRKRSSPGNADADTGEAPQLEIERILTCRNWLVGFFDSSHPSYTIPQGPFAASPKEFGGADPCS